MTQIGQFKIPEYVADFIFHELSWYLIIGWLGYSTICLFTKKITNYYIFESIPGVFVTLGLLGTFLGITYGLIHFNVDAEYIKTSITELLEGLKNAFFTSISGIILSLIFGKFVKYQINNGKITERYEDEELQLFRSINTSLKEINESGDKRTEILANAISKKVSVLEEKFEKLYVKFDQVFENLAEQNAGAIQEALKEVIEDFNDVFRDFIGELVDKNFNKLTESIDALVKWQQQYKSDIESIRDAYAQMVEKHSEFVKITGNWVNNLDEIAGKSSALKGIVEEFKAAFNDDSNFSEIIGKIENSVNELATTSKQVKSLYDNLGKTTSSFDGLKDEVTEWLNKEDGVREQTIAVADALKEVKSMEVTQIENMEESFNRRLANTLKGLDDVMLEQLKLVSKKNKN